MIKNEDYCSYELSKKLQEKGFNEPCDYCYSGKSRSQSWICYDSDPYAPTLYEASRWLREEKGLFINVWLCACGYGWEINKCSTPENRGTSILLFDEESGDDEPSGMWTTYELALTDAINKASELI